MLDATDEMMLAQEQGVRLRKSGEKKELEGGFGDELEGTLILTNRRLIFACSNEKEDILKPGRLLRSPIMRLVYSDIEDLNSIPATGGNLSIQLSSLSSVKGHPGPIESPSLVLIWREYGKEDGRVFIERLKGRSRRRNLNDWTQVILRLKDRTQKLTPLPKPPSVDKLDGKVMVTLGDMQKKGLVEIEDETENQFKIKLDPDDVQAPCDRLAGSGLLERIAVPSGDVYYRKRSPLGEDTL